MKVTIKSSNFLNIFNFHNDFIWNPSKVQRSIFERIGHFLWKLAIFIGKHVCCSLFLIMLQAFRPATSLKETATHVSSSECCKIFRNSYFVEHLWWLLKCRFMTLKQIKVASTVFLRGSFRKLFLNYWSAGGRISTVESNLSKVAQQGYRNHCPLWIIS